MERKSVNVPQAAKQLKTSVNNVTLMLRNFKNNTGKARLEGFKEMRGKMSIWKVYQDSIDSRKASLKGDDGQVLPVKIIKKATKPKIVKESLVVVPILQDLRQSTIQIIDNWLEKQFANGALADGGLSYQQVQQLVKTLEHKD